jgi:hypothetical protein
MIAPLSQLYARLSSNPMGSDAVHEPEREQKTSRGLGAAHSGTLVCRRLYLPAPAALLHGPA